MQTDNPIFIVHVLCADREWHPLAQKGHPPYSFANAAEAWRMADICYPDQCRDMRLGGAEQVRVTRISPDSFRRLFNSGATPEMPETIL